MCLLQSQNSLVNLFYSATYCVPTQIQRFFTTYLGLPDIIWLSKVRSLSQTRLTPSQSQKPLTKISPATFSLFLSQSEKLSKNKLSCPHKVCACHNVRSHSQAIYRIASSHVPDMEFLCQKPNKFSPTQSHVKLRTYTSHAAGYDHMLTSER